MNLSFYQIELESVRTGHLSSMVLSELRGWGVYNGWTTATRDSCAKKRGGPIRLCRSGYTWAVALENEIPSATATSGSRGHAQSRRPSQDPGGALWYTLTEDLQKER